jgi:hypothetical protein
MDLRGFLGAMVIAPEDEMDPSMQPRFKALLEKDESEVMATDILHILDDCVHSGACSGFCVTVLDACWMFLLECEGKTREQGFAEATWRKEEGRK